MTGISRPSTESKDPPRILYNDKGGRESTEDPVDGTGDFGWRGWTGSI